MRTHISVQWQVHLILLNTNERALSVCWSNYIVRPWLHSPFFPPFSSNEWTGRQALAPSAGQQLKKESTVEKWVIFPWCRNTRSYTCTLNTEMDKCSFRCHQLEDVECTMLPSHQGSYLFTTMDMSVSLWHLNLCVMSNKLNTNWQNHRMFVLLSLLVLKNYIIYLQSSQS